MAFSKAAGSFEMLVIGRFSIGLACGFFTGLAPLYVSEIAPVKIRGEIGTINQGFVNSIALRNTSYWKKIQKFRNGKDTCSHKYDFSNICCLFSLSHLCY